MPRTRCIARERRCRPGTESLGAASATLAEVVHGTTLVTNTLIERKGANTGLVTTQGMRDALDIGREWRYDIYDLDIVLPTPLVPPFYRVEAAERLDARGNTAQTLDDAELDRIAHTVAALKVESVAISGADGQGPGGDHREGARAGQIASFCGLLSFRDISGGASRIRITHQSSVKPSVVRQAISLSSRRPSSPPCPGSGIPGRQRTSGLRAW
jgi:hypothetical protein